MRKVNSAPIHTVPGRSAAHYGTVIIDNRKNQVPGRSAVVAGPPPKNAGECGALTRKGENCKAKPTASGLCVGHTKQAEARARG